MQRTAPTDLVKKPRKKVRNERKGTYSYDDEKADDTEVGVVDDEDSYEYVDKFRFKVDADSLRAAIMQKTKLIATQQSSSFASSSADKRSSDDDNSDGADSDNMGDITFNHALLDKLTTEAIIDDTGEKTTYRLVMDIDEFEAMIETSNKSKRKTKNRLIGDDDIDGNEFISGSNSEEDVDMNNFNSNMYSPDGVYVDMRKKEERKKSLLYSESKMTSAEDFINRDTKSAVETKMKPVNVKSSSFKVQDRDLRNDDAENVPEEDSEEALEAETKFYFVRQAEKNPKNPKKKLKRDENGGPKNGLNKVKGHDRQNLQTENSRSIGRNLKKEKEVAERSMQVRPKPNLELVDMNVGFLTENIYGTAVIGLALVSCIALFDKISVTFVLLFQQILVRAMPYVPFRLLKTEAWRRCAKPLLLSSVLFCQLFLSFCNWLRERNRYAGLGYREGETYKRKSVSFRERFPFLQKIIGR